MTPPDSHLPTTAPWTPMAGYPSPATAALGAAPTRSAPGGHPLSPSRSWAVVVVVTAATVAGCAVSTDAERGRQERVTVTEATKNGTAELGTDPGPLRARFPVLDGPTTARWMSGTRGDLDIPGPSTYWIDAVITLPQQEVDELMSAYSPAVAGETPDRCRRHACTPAGRSVPAQRGLRRRIPTRPSVCGGLPSPTDQRPRARRDGNRTGTTRRAPHVPSPPQLATPVSRRGVAP